MQVYSLLVVQVVHSGGADTNLQTLQSLCSRSAILNLEHLHSNYHLYDD